MEISTGISNSGNITTIRGYLNQNNYLFYELIGKTKSKIMTRKFGNLLKIPDKDTAKDNPVDGDIPRVNQISFCLKFCTDSASQENNQRLDISTPHCPTNSYCTQKCVYPKTCDNYKKSIMSVQISQLKTYLFSWR